MLLIRTMATASRVGDLVHTHEFLSLHCVQCLYINKIVKRWENKPIMKESRNHNTYRVFIVLATQESLTPELAIFAETGKESKVI